MLCAVAISLKLLMAAESKRVTWSLDEEGGFDPRLGIPAQPTDSLSRPQKPVKLTIFSMIQDVSVEKHFASGRLTTAEDIHRAVFEELDLPEDCKEVFSVWLSSKHLQLQLKPYHCPCKLFKRWKDLLTQFTSVPYKEMDEGEAKQQWREEKHVPLKDWGGASSS